MDRIDTVRDEMKAVTSRYDEIERAENSLKVEEQRFQQIIEDDAHQDTLSADGMCTELKIKIFLQRLKIWKSDIWR